MAVLETCAVAEAFGRRILERAGSRIVAFFWTRDEKNTLQLLREVAVLDDQDQAKIIQFLKNIHRRGSERGPRRHRNPARG